MACSLAPVSFDVCIWCGETDVPVPHLVGAHCTKLSLWEPGMDELSNVDQMLHKLAPSQRYLDTKHNFVIESKFKINDLSEV